MQACNDIVAAANTITRKTTPNDNSPQGNVAGSIENVSIVIRSDREQIDDGRRVGNHE